MTEPRRPRRRDSRLRPPPKDGLLALRVEPDFDVELDRFIGALKAQYPWVRLTRSDAVRWLLEDGLKRLAGGDDGK